LSGALKMSQERRKKKKMKQLTLLFRNRIGLKREEKDEK